MKAFVIDGYKPSDGGRIADVPDPVPADGEVLVQIHAAGVNMLGRRWRRAGSIPAPGTASNGVSRSDLCLLGVWAPDSELGEHLTLLLSGG